MFRSWASVFDKLILFLVIFIFSVYLVTSIQKFGVFNRDSILYWSQNPSFFFPPSSVTVMNASPNLSAFFTLRISYHVYEKNSPSTKLKSLDFLPLLKLCPANSHCFGSSLLPSNWILKLILSSFPVCSSGKIGLRQPTQLLSETDLTFTSFNPLICPILCNIWYVQRNICM